LPGKDKLFKIIKSLNGTKLDDYSSLFDRRDRKSEKEGGCSSIVVLIAYVPVRTYKYLMALALGIPIVSADWVFDCKKFNKLHPFNRYQLPNGHSCLEKEKEYISPRPSVNGIFQGKTFFSNQCIFTLVLLSKDPNGMLSNWRNILISCGADVISNKRENCDYVLCIGSNNFLGNFDSGIFVSHEWAIECLVHQAILDPAAHSSFTEIA
jgi:BRCA1 C Terminus (BRCT) domain